MWSFFLLIFFFINLLTNFMFNQLAGWGEEMFYFFDFIDGMGICFWGAVSVVDIPSLILNGSGFLAKT